MAKIDRQRTVIFTIAIVLVVATVTIFAFRAIYSHQAEESEGLATAPSSVEEPGSGTTDNTSAEQPPSAIDDDIDGPVQYEGEDPNNSNSIDAVLTYYGLQGKEYIVNVNIAQYVSGDCRITLGSYTGSTQIDQNASDSACSFRIDSSKLSSGLQNLTIEINAGQRSGRIEEKIDVNL